LNAVFGVTYSASAFAVRCALANDVPTNEGFYSLVDVIVPPNTMLNPTHPAPVAAGNVETSQRIADVVLRALAKVLPAKLPAASSGTMMNVILGGRRKSGGKFWAYYETIGGGSGARPAEDGISGVQVNMTNTLNTPLEIAERAYPIEFTEYRLRRGSGGKGKFKGGDGIKRSFRATSKCDFTILSDRFLTRPWGLKGGEEGSSGSVIIHRHNSKEEIMPSKFSTKLDPEDEVRIETPGGGGWGSPES
jgi:N-methylhydantoinase B